MNNIFATNKFLKYAIASGCLPALEFLWELKTTGISIKWFNVAMNALEYAAVCGKIDVFQFILQHCSELGINPAQQPYLIHCAVLSGSKAMVDHASAYCTQRNINQTVQCQKIEGVGGNILHMAFRANHREFAEHVFRLCKTLGVNLSETYNGKNIIHIAVLRKNPELIMLARQICANEKLPFTPQTTDAEGHDAIHYAAGDERLIQALTSPLPVQHVVRPLNI